MFVGKAWRQYLLLFAAWDLFLYSWWSAKMWASNHLISITMDSATELSGLPWCAGLCTLKAWAELMSPFLLVSSFLLCLFLLFWFFWVPVVFKSTSWKQVLLCGPGYSSTHSVVLACSKSTWIHWPHHVILSSLKLLGQAFWPSSTKGN